VRGGGRGDINRERCRRDPSGVELIPCAFHVVVNSMVGGIVSILQVMVVGGTEGSQSHTETLEGNREGDLVQFCSQAANDIGVFALTRKRRRWRDKGVHKGTRSKTKVEGEF